MVMWREIFTYNSAILVVNVEIEDYVVVHLSYFIYEPKLNGFVETSQKKQTIRRLKTESNRISCLACKVVLDHSCGVFLPYFVVQDNKYCYLLCLNTNNEWILRYSFAVPKLLGKHIQLCDTSYTIENGPMLIWTVRDLVFTYKPEHLSTSMNRPVDGILRIPLLSKACHGEICPSILWWKSSACSEQGIIILKNDEETNFYLVRVDEKMKADVTLSKPIIPSLYLAITSCTVCIPDQALLSECSINSYRVFISTTQGQLLEFSEGKYIKHLNIPLVSCQSMQVFQRPSSNLILLCSQEEQICAVDWISCKVFKTFQPFSNLLIDDFIGLGTSQALLVCDSRSEGSVLFDNFVLTDFCDIDVLKCKEDKKDKESSSSVAMKSQSTEVEGSVNNVVNALMKKLQATEVSIIECEMEKSEKKSFVKRHCESLDKILLNEVRPSLLQNSGLAQLVTGLVTKDTVAHAETSKIVVITKWQQILNSEWIIGVEIENIGPRNIHDVSLCTINKTRGILSSSSKLQLSEVQSKETQLLHSGQRATVMAIASLPKYSLEFTVGLMVTWKHVEEDEFLSQCCGDMTLRIDEVMNSAEKKCQCVAALHSMSTQVVVSGCDVPSAVTLLKSNMDICECSLLLRRYHLRYSASSVIPHVEWTCGNNVLVMNFYTSDYHQVCWCLSVLKRQLAADVTWRPLINSSVMGFAITCFENEIRLRISELDDLLTVSRAESIECYDVREEISGKRRKISQHDRSSKLIDLNISRKTSLDICSCLCCTENAFLALFFLQ